MHAFFFVSSIPMTTHHDIDCPSPSSHTKLLMYGRAFVRGNLLRLRRKAVIGVERRDEARLQLVVVLSVQWHIRLDTLLETDTLHNTTSLGCLVGRVTWQDLIMIKHRLWESLTGSI